jgi:hypothetical protein
VGYIDAKKGRMETNSFIQNFVQGKVKDLPEGGRPLFFHEVIDMGGEAIKAQEYFGVGKTIEFRYGIKLAQCIRSNDFNCLGGIYDAVRF